MKVLLDENLPKRLKFRLLEQGHLTSTAREMGWNGKKNGELLGLLTFGGFDVLITSDKNLIHPQNLEKFSITVVLLDIKANRYSYIQPQLNRIFQVLTGELNERFIIIE
jgi:predicted nuclease of predicted toxin-antitoxin system